ncbi:MAG: hypothetical protein ACREYC_21755 [Gammaproteobacteria bacterium]
MTDTTIIAYLIRYVKHILLMTWHYIFNTLQDRPLIYMKFFHKASRECRRRVKVIDVVN